MFRTVTSGTTHRHVRNKHNKLNMCADPAQAVLWMYSVGTPCAGMIPLWQYRTGCTLRTL
jgi:hypothetical protein